MYFDFKKTERLKSQKYEHKISKIILEHQLHHEQTIKKISAVSLIKLKLLYYNSRAKNSKTLLNLVKYASFIVYNFLYYK